MSCRLFETGGQSIGASASASVLPMNIQGWFPLGWSNLISLQSRGLLSMFSSTTDWLPQISILSISNKGNPAASYIMVEDESEDPPQSHPQEFSGGPRSHEAAEILIPVLYPLGGPRSMHPHFSNVTSQFDNLPEARKSLAQKYAYIVNKYKLYGSFHKSYPFQQTVGEKFMIWGSIFHSSGCNTQIVCVQLFVTPWTVAYPGSSVHRDSPGKNTGVGCHALLQGILPTQGSNPGLLHCRQILYHLSQQESPLKII